MKPMNREGSIEITVAVVALKNLRMMTVLMSHCVGF